MPYTACKLVTYELVSSLLHASLAHRAEAAAGSGQLALPEPPRWALVLFSGMVAGATAAFVSQPFDLLLTRVCGASSGADLLECAMPGQGFRNQVGYLFSLGPAAFTGLAPRLAMISVMTACQFFLYDSLRTSLNCSPPSAGAAKASLDAAACAACPKNQSGPPPVLQAAGHARQGEKEATKLKPARRKNTAATQ